MGMAEDAPHPVGGIDYPRTLKEFDEWFPTEAACADFVRRFRWPDGFRCPPCGGTMAWPTAEANCGADNVSVKHRRRRERSSMARGSQCGFGFRRCGT